MTKKNADTNPLELFMDRAVRAEKIRHPLRCTLRVMHAISLKRFGLPPGGGWKTPDPREVDNKFLSDVLWRAYWQGLPELARLYENGLEAIEAPEEEMAGLPSGQCSWMSPERPVLLLPPKTRPEYIPEQEPEIIDVEPLPVIDPEELAKEAEAAANEALSVFQGDSELWEEPEALLREIEATLVAVSPNHPDKLSLFERVTFVRECFYRLRDFEEEFERVMTTPRHPDEAWQLSWLAKASMDLQRQGLMPTPESLRRASIPHFLCEKWQAKTASGSRSEQKAETAPVDAVVNKNNQSFTGPASSPDSCF